MPKTPVVVGIQTPAEQSSSQLESSDHVSGPLSSEMHAPQDSPALKKAISSALSEVREFEKHNSAIVEKIIISGRGEKLYVSVSAPTTEQLESIYAKFTQLQTQFPESSPDAKRFRRVLDQMIREYTQFPKKFNVISLAILDGGKTARFSSIFSDNVEEELPNAAGMIVDNGDGSLRFDWEWNSEASWARKRFGHLFKVEPEIWKVEGTFEN